MIRNQKLFLKSTQGYTLVELMLVVVIISVLASIVTPKFDLVLQRAYQSKAKSNLGQVRTGINLYYSDHEGKWPLANYPQGDTHYTVDGLSLSSLLVPQYISNIPIPKLMDRQPDFNGLSFAFDEAVDGMMKQNPPEDVFIVWGPQDYTPLLSSPYAYDNQSGLLYYPNGNYDVAGQFFYDW